MLVEELMFNIVAIVLFSLIFFIMIKRNDADYISLLILQFLGIFISFVEIFSGNSMDVIVVLRYIISIILPLIAIILEKKGFVFTESKNLVLAYIFWRFGNDRKAKDYLLDIIERNENNYYAHKLLAKIYDAEGGRRRAIDEYVKLVEIKKDDKESYFKISTLLNELEKKDEAAQMLTTLFNNDPTSYEVADLLGNILLQTGKYKEAESVFNTALKHHPGNYEIYYNLGIVYTMLNDFVSAKGYYEQASQINTLQYNAKYNLAEIALIYKELDEAEKYFMETLADEELSADSYFELSRIYLIKGDKEKAINYANAAIDTNPRKIVKRIDKDQLFITIKAKLSIPFNLNSLDENEEEKGSKLSEKERRAKEHLEDTCDITRHLSYGDIIASVKKEKEAMEEKQESRESSEEEIWQVEETQEIGEEEIIPGSIGEALAMMELEEENEIEDDEKEIQSEIEITEVADTTNEIEQKEKAD